jgi:hypothetical protein
MAANTTPIFVLAPRVASANVNAANTNRDGTGTLVDMVTAGANGTRVDRLVFEAAVTTTAGVIRIFHFDGTNNRLWKEILVTAITPSTTVAAFRWVEERTDGQPVFALASGDKLKFTMHNAESMNAFAHVGDY